MPFHDARREQRDKLLQAELARMPKWYAPRLNVLALVAFFTFNVTLCLFMIERFRWWLLPVAFATFVVGNFIEWLVHRQILHRPFGGAHYHEHAGRHHAIYQDVGMRIGDSREYYFVLMSVKSIVALTVAAIGLALLAGFLFGADVGWTVLAVLGAYTPYFELCHLYAHTRPDDDGRRPEFYWRHWRHHDCARMNEKQFTLTPLAGYMDWILGTHASDPEP